MHSELLAQHPGLPLPELARVQAEAWKEMPEAERRTYTALAEEDVKRYHTDMREVGLPVTRAERRAAAVAGPSAASGKRLKRRKEINAEMAAPRIPWALPQGYAIASEAPTAEELEFGNSRGDAIVGRPIMYNWSGVGWCTGIVESRNDDRRFKVDGDFVNFWVYYEVDKNLSRHVLLLEDYAHGADAPENAWVLLDKMPPGPGE